MFEAQPKGVQHFSGCPQGVNAGFAERKCWANQPVCVDMLATHAGDGCVDPAPIDPYDSARSRSPRNSIAQSATGSRSAFWTSRPMARKLRIAAIVLIAVAGVVAAALGGSVCGDGPRPAVLPAGTPTRSAKARSGQPRTREPGHRPLQRSPPAGPVAGGVHRRTDQRLAGAPACRSLRRRAAGRNLRAARGDRRRPLHARLPRPARRRRARSSRPTRP